ncbi:MAG: hypothetical protein HRO68_05555 [Nitrosopumilus sp.]|nr:hypothetical protein [Nitrosopumilus sp.]
MKQINKKHSLLFAIPVLAALVFSSLGTTNAFAEDANISLVPDNVSSARTDALLDVSDQSSNRHAEVEFSGGTDGWTIIGGQAYTSNIELMTGNAARQDNGVWKVKSVAEITVGDRHATLDLKGKAVNGKLRLHGTGTLDSGDSFRIILRGHYAPIHGQSGDFALDWSTAKIQNMENGIRIPLFQDGIVNVWPAISVVDKLDDLVDELNVEE